MLLYSSSTDGKMHQRTEKQVQFYIAIQVLHDHTAMSEIHTARRCNYIIGSPKNPGCYTKED